MHAYLLTGVNKQEVFNEAQILAKKYASAIYEFPVAKISEVRELNNFLKFSVTEPTSIIIKDADLATIPALNAFLKTLEEPQENVYFILTAASEYKVIPTIVSRCQVIKIQNSKFKIQNENNISDFLELPVGMKFLTLDKTRSREEAINFIENIIHSLHEKLLNEKKDKFDIAEKLKAANRTLSALNANGNVGLQLTNFVVNSSTLDKTG